MISFSSFLCPIWNAAELSRIIAQLRFQAIGLERSQLHE